ncbi:MAG: fused MFS/spermidine synthase [Planctomycetota bacterium]|jgi:spermidine synthase|nr:fused MFS/spermidine synthase [Planctomycetota bacterium]
MKEQARRLYLVVVAVTMGALVMALEVLGTRVIGVLYGSSLYVWGALISVTLVALASGYFVGGMLADRSPKAWLLYVLLMCGGIATLIVPWLRGVMLPCYRAFGLRWGALASATAIFFVPLLLLGMTGPFVIRLLSRAVESSGRTAGTVYALSTLGSVAGTLAVTFYLIPAAGTSTAVRLVGGCVIAVCAIGLALEIGPTGLVVLLPAAAALKGGGLQRDERIALHDSQGNPFEIIYRDESAYGRLAVLETVDERLLLADGILQTGMPAGHYSLERGRLLAEQGYYLELLPYLVESGEGKRALAVGLAGGLLPGLLRLHDIETLAVEIDPKMAEISRRFFNYSGELVVQDGRRFVEDCRQEFDFCVIDAYASDVLPFHLVTREMFQAVRRRLAPDGILAINLITAPGGWVANSVHRTLMAAFPSVWGYRSGDNDGVQPLFYFASEREPEISRRWVFDIPPDEGVADLTYALQQRRLPAEPGTGIVLTDEYNPVDVVRAPEALEWRERTIKTLGIKSVLH